MDVLLLMIALLVGLAAGWAAGAARGRARAATDRSDLLARLAAAEARAHSRDVEIGRLDELRRETAAQTRAAEAQRAERDRREQSVLRALAPVDETLRVMRDRVEAIEADRNRQFGAVTEQLRLTHEAGEALRATTESLAGALRSGATRGAWGAAQLRRVVEAAGLTRYVDFDLQTSVATDGESGSVGRPDMVVRLPGDRALAVDAKAPFDAYFAASDIPLTARGAEAARRRALLAEHVKAVRSHVDALAKKRYWAGLATSPEFVVCFLPSESLLAAALEEDPSLLDHAFKRRVALASPVNLWAVLKTVSYSWAQQDVSVEARRLFDLGTELHGRLGSLAGHADQLRRSIERTVDSYNRFAGSLETRVLVTARKFPGIDDSKLDSLPTASAIDRTPRRLTAPETWDDNGRGTTTAADLDDLRARLAADPVRDVSPTDHRETGDQGQVPADAPAGTTGEELTDRRE